MAAEGMQFSWPWNGDTIFPNFGRMLMTIRFLILSTALLAVACYEPPETVALAENADMLDGRPVRPVPEDSEIFGVWTHGRSALNVDVGRFLNAAEIEDPAAHMEAALVRHLADRVGAAGIGAPLAFGPNKPDDLVAWARDHSVTGLIIDIDTQMWGFEWWSSSVRYRAMFRLIDPVSGRTIAQHLCDIGSPVLEHGPKTPQNPFPRDDVSRALLADDAAPIKAIINELAERCVEDITSAAL